MNQDISNWTNEQTMFDHLIQSLKRKTDQRITYYLDRKNLRFLLKIEETNPFTIIKAEMGIIYSLLDMISSFKNNEINIFIEVECLGTKGFGFTSLLGINTFSIKSRDYLQLQLNQLLKLQEELTLYSLKKIQIESRKPPIYCAVSFNKDKTNCEVINTKALNFKNGRYEYKHLHTAGGVIKEYNSLSDIFTDIERLKRYQASKKIFS